MGCTDGDGIYKLDAKGNKATHFAPSSSSTGNAFFHFQHFQKIPNMRFGLVHMTEAFAN